MPFAGVQIFILSHMVHLQPLHVISTRLYCKNIFEKTFLNFFVHLNFLSVVAFVVASYPSTLTVNLFVGDEWQMCAEQFGSLFLNFAIEKSTEKCATFVFANATRNSQAEATHTERISTTPSTRFIAADVCRSTMVAACVSSKYTPSASIRHKNYSFAWSGRTHSHLAALLGRE